MTAPAVAGLSVQILQENLARVVGIVERAINAKTTLPITLGVLLATDRGRVMVRATDLKIMITAWAGGKIDVEGATVVPAKLFGDLLATLPAVAVSLTLNERTLYLECARAKGKLQTMDAEDFPIGREVSGGSSFVIPAQMLARALEHTIFAAATTEDRPVLNGVCVRVSGGEMTMAAADGIRLSVYTSPVEGDADFILPLGAAREVQRIASGSHENVEVTVSPKAALFALTDLEITASLTEGTYPNYPQLIPADHRARVTIEAAAFKAAVRQAAVYAREGSGHIRMYVSSGQLRLTGRADEVGDGDILLDAEVEGEATRACLDVRYLHDLMGVLDGKLAIDFIDESHPVVFRRAEDASFTHVAMPMFVKWGDE